MSEISKARERMLHKRGVSQQPEEYHTSRDKPYPRKFTVSSLTQQLDHRPSEPHLSPHRTEHSPANTRKQSDISRQPSNVVYQRPKSYRNKIQINTDELMPQTPSASKVHRSHITISKQNPPLMLKTINIKIAQVNQLPHLSRVSQSQTEEDLELESRFHQSPPKVDYRRPLHKEKLDLVLVPPAERRHHSPYKPRECLKKWAEDVIAEARKHGRTFIDQYFPPARTIVFNRKILYQQQGLKFQRLSRIYSCQTYLIDSCEPTLLSLGKYSNPYLYSALTILSEEPVRVMSIFNGQEATEEGAYHICLCKDGVWRYIIVDDFMPIKSIAGRKQMLFIHSRQAEKGVELWPALIEKAIAKIYGTYLDLAMIRQQGMTQIFRLLTGAPVSTYLLNKDFRSFLILIDAALKRNHIVTLQAVHEQHAQTANLKNLVIHQAYKVLDIRKSGLKIRNYAEPELVTKLSFGQCLIFSKLVIYRVEQAYRYVSYKLRHKKHFYSKLAIKVPTTSRGYFDTWQNNPAYYKKHLGSNIDYQQSRVRMWLSRRDEEQGQGEWIEPGKEVYLDEGAYEMKIHLCQDREYDFTVSYYGEKDLVIEREKCMEEWMQPCLCLKK